MTPQQNQASTTALQERVAAQNSDSAPEGTTLRHSIKLMEQQWATALPKTVSPDRFVRTVLTEVSKTPKLGDCEISTFLGACTQAAQLGLEFGPLGLAYLVPFWNKKKKQNECQLIVGYKGYIQLARRSGEVKDIKAVAVHEHDRAFDYWEDELGTHLIHRPAFDDRGEVVRYYGRCTFTNGGSLVMLVSLGDIQARKDRSQSAGQGYSPWQSDEEAMRLKTVVRIMTPWLPLATEVAQALASDEQVIRLQGKDLMIERAPEPDPAGDTGPIDTTAIAAPSENRGQLVAELNSLLDSAEPVRAKAIQSDLVREFEPLENMTEAGLRDVIAFVRDWKAPGERPPTAETPPVDDPAVQGPTEAPEQGERPETGEDPMVTRIRANLNGMKAADVDLWLRYCGEPTGGDIATRRLRLLPPMVTRYRDGDQAVIDLF